MWELGFRAGMVDPIFFPPPSHLGSAAVRLCQSGDLPAAILATLSRALLGFFPGALAGIAIGAATGSSQTIRRMLEPSLSSLYSMPKLALLPIFLLILGVGETARIALISLGTCLAMSIQVFDGVRGIDQGFVEMARNYGASRWMLLRKVYFPGAMPSIFTGSRITLGRAIVLAISVELVTGSPGLGNMIWLAWQTFSTERLYVSVAAAGLIGFISQTSLLAIEKRALRWRYA
jgi:ABC-type nitrate/sulfonate/bicarbonate transport system permease component